MKVEFNNEDGIVVIYVNDKIQGSLKDSKLYGSPHNTYIDIYWYCCGNDGSVRVFSSTKKLKQNLRGTIAGIKGVKNGSSLRREGVSWN